MKRYLILIIGFITLLYSCGGKNDPAPITSQTSSTTTTTGTTGTGTSGGTTATITLLKTVMDGGNGTFDTNGNLMTIFVSRAGTTQGMQTGSGGTDKTSLVHAEAATITQTSSGWRANFANYSATDTTKQAYIRDINVDATGKITERRAYVTGVTATLDYYSKTLLATMTAADFQTRFNSATQQILVFNQ